MTLLTIIQPPLANTAKTLSIVLFLLGVPSFVTSHNVIALPHPCLARSHVMTFVKIGKAMVDRGHGFTIILSSEDVDTVVHDDAFNVITYPSLYSRAKCLALADDMASASPIGAAKIYVDVGLKYCESILPRLESLLSQDADVFLGELTWPCSSIVADLMDQSSSIKVVRLLYHGNIMVDPFGEHFGLPSPANEAPGMGLAMWMLTFEKPMSLLKRTVNLLFREVSRQIVNMVMLRPYNKVRRMAGVTLTSEVEAMHSTASLIFVPLVWGVEPPRALPPNWKAIHPVLPSPSKALPAEIQTWIDSHCSGDKRLVVLSFGTQVTLSETQSSKIFAALVSLEDDFCFIWQLSTRSSPPAGLVEQDHILVLPWIPQNDVLHYATVFISHVGYGSLYEAAYHGVPLVCIPIFGDQDDNAARAVYGGWGVRLNKEYFTAQELVDAIHQVGKEGSPFRTRATAISKLVRAKSGTEAILEWMEYAATHGVDHLVPFRTMSATYLAYYNLDAGLILAFIVSMSIFALCNCCRRCFRQREQVADNVNDTKMKRA